MLQCTASTRRNGSLEEELNWGRQDRSKRGAKQPEDVPEIAVGTFIETPKEPDTRLHRYNFAFP